MNWYSQLTRLIFDFYREDAAEMMQLSALQCCKVSRWWGVFRINCQDMKTARAMIDAIELLREPIAHLRLANQIKILVDGRAIATFPVQVVQFNHKSYGERQS